MTTYIISHSSKTLTRIRRSSTLLMPIMPWNNYYIARTILQSENRRVSEKRLSAFMNMLRDRRELAGKVSITSDEISSWFAAHREKTEEVAA